jgi:hypothetical protein
MEENMAELKTCTTRKPKNNEDQGYAEFYASGTYDDGKIEVEGYNPNQETVVGMHSADVIAYPDHSIGLPLFNFHNSKAYSVLLTSGDNGPVKNKYEQNIVNAGKDIASQCAEKLGKTGFGNSGKYTPY